jgi:hypothetical protein
MSIKKIKIIQDVVSIIEKKLLAKQLIYEQIFWGI